MNLSALITAQTAAILPAPILWAAAQFASKDAGKAALCQIQLTRSDSGAVTVRSVDGHKTFRVTLPAELAHLEAAELLIPAAEWTKPGKLLTAAEWVQLRTDGTAAAVRADGLSVELRQWFDPNRPGASQEYRPQFPNLDQVWPDRFECEPGALIGANGNYLSTIATVAAKLSPSGWVTMESNAPTQPLQFTAPYRETDAVLQFLLMPVQIRNSADAIASQEAKRDRDRQRAADAAELERYRQAAATQLPAVAMVAA